MNVNDFIHPKQVDTTTAQEVLPEQEEGVLRRLQFNKGSKSLLVSMPRKLVTKLNLKGGDYLRFKQVNDSIIIKKAQFIA